MICLLAEIRTNQEMLAKVEAKADANLRGMKVEIRTNQERVEAKIAANNEKFEALQDTLPDGYPPRQDRGHSRRNENQDEQKLRKDGGSDR
jgi:hypothetical protein